MSYLKPQTPIQLNENYIYPLTTADQVILNNGNRLNSLFKKTIKETATLQVANWSDTLPYTQTITLTESTDDYNVDANIVYNGNEADTELNKAAGCISYIKKNHKNITFYCLKEKPMINIPVEITGTCRNTIADVTVEEGIKLNFDIVAYATEEEMLADTPIENTIGVVTDVPITGYKFSATEPETINEGEVWIKTGDNSGVAFDIVEGTKIYPLYVKQYINGTWVDKTALSYQSGEFREWMQYLFNYGTLGHQWQAKALLHSDTSSSSIAYAPTVTNNDDGSITITQIGASSGKTRRGGYLLNELIDFTDIKTVVVLYDVVEATSFEFGLSILPVGYSDYREHALAQFVTTQSTSLDGTMDFDVSNINEKGYLFISTHASNSHTLKITLKEVYYN